MADDEFKDALKEAAWQVVKENPGIDCGEWIRTLIRQFPTEVVDALGTDPYDVHHILTDWWTEEYYDGPDDSYGTFSELSEFYAQQPEYLQEELDKARSEILTLRQKILNRDAEITKLKNAINELKKD